MEAFTVLNLLYDAFSTYYLDENTLIYNLIHL